MCHPEEFKSLTFQKTKQKKEAAYVYAIFMDDYISSRQNQYNRNIITLDHFR